MDLDPDIRLFDHFELIRTEGAASTVVAQLLSREQAEARCAELNTLEATEPHSGGGYRVVFVRSAWFAAGRFARAGLPPPW